jgi:hypothetical protein
MGFRRFPAAVFARPPVIKAGRGRKEYLEGRKMNYFSLNKLEKGLLVFLGVLIALVVLEFALATRYDVAGTVVDKEIRYTTRTEWWAIPIGVPTGGGLYYDQETEVQYVLVVVCMDEEEGRVPVSRGTYRRIEDGQKIRVHGWQGGITGMAYGVSVEVVE